MSMRDRRIAREQYWENREGLQYGVPRHAMSEAVSQMRAMESGRHGGPLAEALGTSSAATSLTWSFIGPEPITEKSNFTGAVVGSDYPATGRITAVAADSNGVIVAGAASGGVWLSTNNGASFTPIFDNEPTQSVGAIALDTTTSPSTIYVATGEGNGALDSLYGQGIFKSSNLGATWTQLGAPGQFDHASFTSLAIDTTTTPGSPRLFAGATNGLSASEADAAIFETEMGYTGLWFSPNGGTTWTQYPASTFDNCEMVSGVNSPCPADDVVIDPSNPQNVYVAIDSDNVYYSNNGGTTFTGADFPPTFFLQGRQSLAVGPPSGRGQSGIVYAMVGAPNGIGYVNMFVSTDAGLSWNPTNLLAPTVPSYSANGNTLDGTSSGNVSQSYYDQAMMVSPISPSTVFFGGVGLYESTNNGNQWTFLPSAGGLHPDQHALVFDPSTGNILVANDGGLYSFSLFATAPVSFNSLNSTISASELQTIGLHPTNPTVLIGGFQDSGTQLYSGGVGTWFGPDSEDGDGGFALIDPNDPTHLYHDFSTGELSGALISESVDSGADWCSATVTGSSNPCNIPNSWTTNLNSVLSKANDVDPAFYPPLAVDPKVAYRVLFGAHKVYVSTNGMQSWALQSTQNLTSSGIGGGESCGTGDDTCSLEDIEFAPSNDTKAWTVAMSNLAGTVAFAVNNTTQANLSVTTSTPNGGQWTDVTGALNNVFPVLQTQATGIAIDPNNSNVAYLSLSGFHIDTGVGHIYKTVNFGTTWSEADGSSLNGGQPGTSPLPDVPVLKVLVDSTDDSGNCGGSACSNSIYAGTDIGVFHSADGGNTWQPYNLGAMPAVPVYDLSQNSAGNIFAGTHGRGVYQLAVASVTPTPTATATATATTTPTATSTATATATTTATATVTVTPTASTTSTHTATATATRSATATATVTFTATPTTTSTGPTLTPTPSRTATPTVSATPTPSATPTATPVTEKLSMSPKTINFGTVKVGMSKSKTVKLKISKSKHAVPIMILGQTTSAAFSVSNPCVEILNPGSTCTVTVTFSPATGGKTTNELTILSNDVNAESVKLEGKGKLVATPISPTRTATPTSSATPTVTSTATPTRSATPTVTITPTATRTTTTATATATPTATITPTATVTATSTASPTSTATRSATATVTATATATPTVTATATRTATATSTATVTATSTSTATATQTATATATPTVTSTPTITATATPTVTATSTTTATATSTSTSTATLR